MGKSRETFLVLQKTKLKFLMFIFFLVLLPESIRGLQILGIKRIPLSCEPHEFPCLDGRSCVVKQQWCDRGNNHCNDGSDESYCGTNSDCNTPDYFECDNGACIPPDGKCDGYPSCEDESDELDCQCEEILNFKSIDYKIYIGKRSSKCWKIVVSPTQYLSLKVNQFNLRGSKCNDAYLKIHGEKLTSEAIKFCPESPPVSISLERFDATIISYHGRRRDVSYDDELNYDSFDISVIIADLLCKKSESFKCTPTLCIIPSKKCDGIEDCYNGKDEQGCEKGVLAVPHVNITRGKGLSWLKKQRNAAWGWRDNTHRAVVAMYLAHGANFNGTNQMEDLTAKQLELQMTTSILSGCEEDKDWDLKAAIEYFQKQQDKINGSFGDLLATSLILPILNAKSLVDIGNINCTENLKMPRDGNPVSDIELRLGQKISIKYCLYIGNEKDQIHPITLRTPTNITVLDIIRLASEADPKYRFEAQTIKGKLYIYKLSGISNDPEDGKFWLLYTKSENETLKITSKSPDKISVNDKDDIVMWYRSAAIE